MILRTLAAAACFSFAAAMTASAATVTVDGTEWEVSTIEGSYNDNQALLESQIWFGNEALAIEFSKETGFEFGTVAPLFTFKKSFNTSFEVFSLSLRYRSLSNQPARPYPVSFRTSTEQTYAVATPVSAVPLPAGGLLLLSAFGGVAALKRRKARVG